MNFTEQYEHDCDFFKFKSCLRWYLNNYLIGTLFNTIQLQKPEISIILQIIKTCQTSNDFAGLSIKIAAVLSTLLIRNWY